LVVFISGEQTKETDENVGSLFLSGLQNFAGGSNRFVNKSIYGKTLCERQIPRGCLERPISSLRVLISDEQTKETDVSLHSHGKRQLFD
jgi:hypothetical protein